MTFLWLDHKIFGNGYGLASPYFDDRFYWLNGELYHWIGGFGAQLVSFQWTHPKPQEERILNGERFRPFNSTRRFGRVEVSWRMINLPKDIDDVNQKLHEFKQTLGSYR